MQVPDELVRWKKFDSGINDGGKVKKILADVSKSRKLKGKGEPYKSAAEMLIEYEISMDQLKSVIKADNDARELVNDKFTLAGNIWVFEDGSVGKSYSRAGELMVKAIEDAYIELGFSVPITGAYLTGTSWASCH